MDTHARALGIGPRLRVRQRAEKGPKTKDRTWRKWVLPAAPVAILLSLGLSEKGNDKGDKGKGAQKTDAGGDALPPVSRARARARVDFIIMPKIPARRDRIA